MALPIESRFQEPYNRPSSIENPGHQPSVHIISPAVDHAMGLGEIKQVEFADVGYHGDKLVAIVTTEAGKTVVVKKAPDMATEINGYRAAQNSPLRDVILTPHYMDEATGVLALPHCDEILGGTTVDLRKAMMQGKVSAERALAIQHHYIDANVAWWQTVQANENEPLVSMQKAEWPEVQGAITTMVERLVAHPAFHGLTAEQFRRTPIQIDGLQLPSIDEITARLAVFYASSPSRIVFGNLDMSPKNLLINPATGDYRNIDLEMVGTMHPGEALAVAIKGAHSLATAEIGEVQAKVVRKRRKPIIAITALPHTVPETGIKFQQQGWEKVCAIAEQSNHPQLPEDVALFTAGNQMHEFAYAMKRTDNPLHALFPLVIAGQALHAADTLQYQRKR